MPTLARSESIEQTYEVGTWEGETFSLPVGTTHVKLRIPCASFPQVTRDVLRCYIDVSMDGGRTWRQSLIWTTSGVPARNELGELSTETSGEFDIKQPENRRRMVRARLSNSERLTTKMIWEASRGDL